MERCVTAGSKPASREAPPEAAPVEPPLKAIHPTRRKRAPEAAMTRLWGVREFTTPFLPKRPSRGPMVQAMQKAATPPTMCTTPEPAKS